MSAFHFRSSIVAVLLSLASFSNTGLAQAPASSPIDPNIFMKLASQLLPSVVNLSTVSRPVKHGAAARTIALGSGFVIDEQGTILTNNHVVSDAERIRISFSDGGRERSVAGEVIARDPELDVALVRERVKTAHRYVPVRFGDSDRVSIGEYVMAVGNPFGQGRSVTHGIVSQKGRAAPDFPLATYLQTDAPINPGNSGGPLVNLRGEVIAVNNAIDVRAHGIGFAIPINLVKNVLLTLKSRGVVTRGYIGVAVENVPPNLAARLGASQTASAPYVTQVTGGAPGDRAGIKPFDLVTKFGVRPVHTTDELVAAVTSTPAGEAIAVSVVRDGKPLALKVRVEKRPDREGDEDSEGRTPTSTSVRPGRNAAPNDEERAGVALGNLATDIAKDLGVPLGTRGVVVQRVAPGSPADSAGLERGDVILDVDRAPVQSVKDFFSKVKASREFLMRVLRPNPAGKDALVAAVLDLQ